MAIEDQDQRADHPREAGRPSQNDQDLWERADRFSRLSRGYQTAQAVITANRLGVFPAIGREQLTPREIAHRIEADPRATTLLLDVLVALGLLEKEGSAPVAPPESEEGLDSARYTCSADALDFLLPDAPWNSCDILRHDGNLYLRWANLAESVRTGRPAKASQGRRSPEEQRDFILGMANVGIRSARSLWEKIDIGERRRLLDLGGGPGTYAAVFCEMYPDAQATNFDLPQTISISREWLEGRSLSHRIALFEGDYLQDEFPPEHDLALLSNIVHALNVEKNMLVVEKAYRALVPGGMIIIKDFRLEDDRVQPLPGAIFSLNMLLGTDGGRAYTTSEMKDWLERAGFKDIRTWELTKVSTIVTGVR